MRNIRFVCLGLFCALALALPGRAQTPGWSWSNPQPHGNDVAGMAWNGSLGVQVCDSGQIYTSSDLISWTPRKSNLTNDLQAVIFFGRRIVVAGAYGAVAYSDDGTNFFASSLKTANWINGLAASSTLAVAVGDHGSLYTSTDGANWGLQNPPPNLYDDWLYGVAYGEGVFVTVGDAGYIATSSNGTNWSSSSSVSAAEYGDLDAVAWLNGSGATATFPYCGFWIVTDNYGTAGNSYSLYSVNNGGSWASVNMDNPSTNSLFTVAANTTTALVAGSSEARLGLTSRDAIVWPDQFGMATNDIPPGTYYASVVKSDGNYVLAGADGILATSSAGNEGPTWSEPWYSARDWLWQITVVDGLYVAVGDNARIMTSADGAAWTVEEVDSYAATNSGNPVLLCVGGTTNLLLAAGSGGSLVVSPYAINPVVETDLDGSVSTNDASSLGIIWYDARIPAGITNDLAGIGVFNHKFFIVGGNGTVLNSPDGTNWTAIMAGGTNKIIHASCPSNYLSGITVCTNAAGTNDLLVLTGNEGTVLTSIDGTNWTTILAGGSNRIAHIASTTNWLSRVHNFNGRLLACGENGTLLTSTNGTNWAALTSGVTNWLNDAVMISNTCYVVGNQGTIVASTNFVNWNPVGTITRKSLAGAATQNGQLVVAGFEGTILRSQIIPEPVNFLQYAQAQGYNVFSVAGTVDQQFTLDYSTNLVDWVTGPLLDIIYGDGTLVFYDALPAGPAHTQYYRCTLAP